MGGNGVDIIVVGLSEVVEVDGIDWWDEEVGLTGVDSMIEVDEIDSWGKEDRLTEVELDVLDVSLTETEPEEEIFLDNWLVFCVVPWLGDEDNDKEDDVIKTDDTVSMGTTELFGGILILNWPIRMIHEI